MQTMTLALLKQLCYILLLLFVHFEVSIISAQHIIVSPQNYHIGVEETFSFTSYDRNDVNVSAVLSYLPCTCARNNFGSTYRVCPGSEKNYKSYSQDSATVSHGQNAIFRIQMPEFPKAHYNRYSLSITDTHDNVYKTQYINFQSYGYILVKTDKPIYKPSQTVKFCAIHVDNEMKPLKSSKFAVQVTVRDNKYRQILKLNISDNKGAFFCKSFPLSDEPSFGQWSINAQLKVSIADSNKCFHVPTPTGSCDFEVKEFVLPKFDVTINGPKSITSNDDIVGISVIGSYVFGERLRGTVRVNATRKSPGKKDILVHEETKELVLGKHNSNILLEKILSKTRYLYNPFCVKGTTIKVVAEITEDGRDIKASDVLTIPLKSDSVSITFANSMSKLFRPGLPYTVKAIVKGTNRLSSSNTKSRIVATINNGRETIYDDTMDAVKDNDEYIVEASFLVPTHANCLKINIYPVNAHYSCETESSICMTPAPFYSPTRSFIQLASQRSVYKVGSEVVIEATSTIPFTILHYIVIANDNLLFHNKLDTATLSGDGVTQTNFTVPVTHNMVPKTKILAGFARTDGELVMDLLEIEIDCELEHKVTLSVNVSNAEPGDGITIATLADPDSIVLLSMSDSSLHLLRESCKSATQDNICKLLGSGNYGNLDYIDTSCSTSSDESLCCPSSCSEPTRYSVQTLFQATGIMIDSDMFIPNPPSPPIKNNRRGPINYYYDTNDMFIDDIQFNAPPLPSLGAPGPSVPLKTSKNGNSDNGLTDGNGKTREFFPESWIWTILEANSAGNAMLTDIIPDTITTWTGVAMAVSSQKGLGISLKQSLTVKKELFVSLELPYSINWGETVIITPLVFNLQRLSDPIEVEISVSVHEELSIVDLMYPKTLSVESSSSEPFNLTIKPRSVGRFYIAIAIYDKISGRSDRVKKELFVKPGCSKHVVTSANFTSESDGKQCYDYLLPSCVIPGSASAQITITGDIMSFSNLDHLLILPSGCGEQNLVKTAINYVVGEYLSATNALQDHVSVKIKNNLQIGYQKQLNYLASSGCFSIWPNGRCSSWLTAAVVRYFSGIHSFYAAQSFGEDVVDDSVIQSAVSYLLNQQKRSGKFDLIGRSHNNRLVNDKGHNANTAFTLVALKRYRVTYGLNNDVKLNDAISKAEKRLDINYGRNNICMYRLAISLYGLHMTPGQREDSAKEDSQILRNKIKNSEEYPGTCFACDLSRTECSMYFVNSERSSVCVETTAYTLLALLSTGDTESTVCLSQWLVRIRNGAGGYYSSQDTIVALEALAMFAETTFTKNIDLRFDVLPSSNVDTTSSHHITEANRYDVHKIEVTSIPSENNCVRWSGIGTGIIQSTLVYYGCKCNETSSPFSLGLATILKQVDRVTTLTLNIRLQYLAQESSNMVILDVEFPSGYSLDNWRDTSEEKQSYIERSELKRSSVVFYLSELPMDSTVDLSLDLKQDIIVSDPQLSPVTVYDYYDPDKTVTEYYRPGTTDIVSLIEEKIQTISSPNGGIRKMPA